MLKALQISKYLLLIAAIFCSTLSSRAAVFGLNSATENNLRTAITNANANGAGLDTIIFYSGGTITLTSALPNITSALLIQGIGARQSIIEADTIPGIAGYRVFNITSAVSVTLNDLTIQNGYITSGNGAGIAATTGDLTLNDCMLVGNRVGGSGSGAAISSSGNLTILRSSLVNNESTNKGGAIQWGPSSAGVKTGTITNSTFSGNKASPSGSLEGGGAISVQATGGTNILKLINCSFKGNTLTGSFPNNGKSLNVFSLWSGTSVSTTLLNCAFDDAGGNYFASGNAGATTSLSRSYTVSSDATMSAAGAGNVNNSANMGLDTLDYHGGTTLLYSHTESSILVDNGTSTGAPDEDQRRVPKSGNKDIGAYEYFEQACDTPVIASPFVRIMADRRHTFTSTDINGQGNVAFVNPGQSVTVTFNYTINQAGGYCPGCIAQVYWGIAGYQGYCVRSFGGYCNCSGSQNQTFSVPTTAGIYYLTTGGGLGFSCSGAPQNRLAASAEFAFGAIVVGNPVNGSLVSVSGSPESCFDGSDSLYSNPVAGYTCTGVNLNTYEWFKDSTAIASSNTENLQVLEEGVYHVRWYNNINESVYSDTFKVNSLVKGFNSPANPLVLSVIDDTLNLQGDSAEVLILNSQIGASYVIIDTANGQAYSDTLSGNGDTLKFRLVPIANVDYGFYAERQGCSRILEESFEIIISTPPLNGVYSVGKDSSFNYQSFQEAIDDAYLKGISGEVTFEVDSGVYNEQLIIHGDSIVGLASNRKLIFKTNASSVGNVLLSDTANGSGDNYVIQLNKARYIEFYDLHIKANNSSFGRVFAFVGANHNLVFKRNKLESVTSSSSSFAFAVFAADGGSGISIDSVTIENNLILKGSIGILLRDNGSDTYWNNRIVSNRFVDFGYMGMFVQSTKNTLIDSNYFKDAGSSSLIYSIYFATSNSAIISNNTIINQSTSAAYGIYTIGLNGSSSDSNLISNNSVSLINSNGGTARGIHAQNNRFATFYYNSIYNNCPNVANGRGVYVTGPPSYAGNVYVNNNIVVDGPGACFEAVSSSGSGIDRLNYNNYVTNGAVLGYWGASNVGSLSAWRTLSGDDAQSVSIDPIYESDTSLLPTSLYFNNKGQAISGFEFDIRDKIRDGITADIGAFEYSPGFPPGEYGYELGSGKSMIFDGVNDYVSASIPELPQNNEPRTLECWMRVDNAPAAPQVLYNWGDAGTVNRRAALFLKANGAIQYVAEANDISGTVSVADGRWHHIAVTFDGSFTTIYVDGVYETDASKTYATTGTTLDIGRRINVNSEFFEGEIDELRIWKADLSESTLREYMCQKISRNHPNVDDLVVYMPFDEGSGNKVMDIASGYVANTVNIDTSAAWRKSGAALGDSSVYYYDVVAAMAPPQGGGPFGSPIPASQGSLELNLVFPNGDSVALSDFTGSDPFGVHLYYVDGAEDNTAANLDKVKMDSLNYWGVYLVDGASTASYKARVYYENDTQLSSYKESAIFALERGTAADSSWDYNPNKISNNVSANYAEIELNEENNEIWFGELDNNKPYAGQGNAISVDGNNDQLTIPNHSDFHFSGGEMSISFWLNRESLQSEDVVLGRWSGNPFHYVFGFDYDGASGATDGQFRIRTSTGYQNVFFNSGKVVGEWEHWTITAKAGQFVKIYRNGKEIRNQAITGTFNQAGNSTVVIGGMGDGTKWFQGQINELSFWKKELTQAELRNVMGLQLDTSDANLVAYYPMNHVAGTDTALDISGNQHHAFLQNADANSVWVDGADTFNILISENKEVGDTLLVLPSYDLDGDSIEFTILSGNVNGAFSLLSEGKLSLADKAYFDYELDSILDITYTISDGILQDTASVIIHLLDENDPPMLGFGGSIQFDGVDDYANLGNGINLANKSFSISFYARTNQPTNPSIYQTFVGQGSVGTRIGLHLGYEQGARLKLGFYNDDLINPLTLDDNWHHYSFTFNAGSKEQRNYIDGQLLGSSIAGGNYVGTGDFLLGKAPWGSLLNGEIDELQVYDRTLSEVEVARNVGRILKGDETGLLAYLKFNEGAGANFFDETGANDAVILNSANPRANHDTILYFVSEDRIDYDTIGYLPGDDPDSFDTLTYRALSGDTQMISILSTGAIVSLGLDYETDSVLDFIAEVSDLAGLKDTANIRVKLKNVVEEVYAGFGNGVALDGSNDFIELEDSANYLNNLTIEAWVKPNAKNNINSIIGNKASGGAQGLALYSNSWTTGDGKLIFEVHNGSSYGLNSPVGLMEVGKWQHVAVTVSGTTAKLYHNGKLVKDTTGNIGPGGLAASAGAWRIGAHNDNSYFYDGSVDEVRIWNVTRSEDEIADWYNKRLDSAASQNGLKVYYNFDQEDGDTRVNDISGNEFDAYFRNMSGNEWYDYPDTLIWEVPENLIKNDTLGWAIAWDVDNSPLSFTKLSGDNNIFDLDVNTGLVRLANSGALDYESMDTLKFMAFEVSENGDGSIDTSVFGIRILDANDPPVAGLRNAGVFDGVNDYISIGSDNRFKPTNELTAELWVNPSQWIANQSFISNTQASGYGLYTSNTGLLNAIVRRAGTYAHLKDSVFIQDLDGWHHLAVTYDGRYTKLYLDAELIAEDDAGANYPIQYVGNSTLIAAEASAGPGPEANWYFDGKLDEVKVWNKAKTAQEIKQQYSSLATSVDSNLVFYLNFEQNREDAAINIASLNPEFYPVVNFANDLRDSSFVPFTLLALDKLQNGDTIGYFPVFEAENDSLRYQLLNASPQAGVFALDSLSGRISISDETQLNYYQDSLYTFDVRVTEVATNISDTAALHIKVYTENEAPYFNSTPANIISCGASLSDTSTVNVLDVDFPDSLSNLSFVGISQDTSLLSSANIFFQSSNDSILNVWTSPNYTNNDDTVVVSIVVLDTEGLTDTTEFNLYINANPQVSVDTIAAPLCFGDSNAFVAINVQDGLSPYSYSWTNGSSNDTLTNVSSGNYAVTVFDSNSCEDTASFTVIDPTALTASILSFTNPSCYQYPDGEAVADATGGFGTYTFVWSDSTSQTTDTASNLLDGIYTVTISDQNACFDTVSVTLVEPAKVPASFAFSDSSICFGDQASLTANSGSGYSYRWKRNGAFMSGLVAQTVQVSGAGAYSVEVTDSSNCFSLSPKDTLQVNNLPSVSLGNLTDECNQPGDTITLIGGLPSGGTYSSTTANAVQSNSFIPAVADTGSHIIIYSYTDANGCSNTDSNTLYVNPKPTASFSLSSSFCVGDTALFLNTGSANFTGTGLYAGNGVSSQYFDPNIAGAGNHTLSYLFTDINSCRDTASVNVTVNAKPTLNHPSLTDQCIGNNSLALSGGSASPTGGSSSYSGTGVSGTTFYPDTAGVGQHFIVYKYTDLNSCSDSLSRSIRVYALPTVSMSTSEYCAVPGSSIQLNLGSPTGGSYSGSGISGQTNFLPGSLGAGSYSINYSYTDNRGCTDSANANLTVNPLPNVSFSSAFSAICESLDSVDISLGTPSANGTGSYAGSGIIGNHLFTSLSGSGTFAVNYTFVDTNSCVDSASQNITVNALPNVSLASQGTYCADVDTVALTGGSPAGGSYSGPGVANGAFVTNGLLGNNQINYSYTDGNGCTDSAQNTIIINALPSVSFNLSASAICINDTALNLTGASPNGGSFTGTGVVAGNFNPSQAGLGSHPITYTYTNNKGCSASSLDSIVVNDVPSITFSSYGAVCLDQPAFLLNQGIGLVSGTSIYSGPGVTANMFDASQAGVGTHTINFTFVDSVNSCSADTSAPIIVRALPQVNLNLPSEYCINDGSLHLTGGSPANGSYSGSGIFGDSLRPVIAGVGANAITYSFTDVFGCVNTQTDVIEINPVPRISPTTVDPICDYASQIVLRPDSIYGSGSYRYQGAGVTSDTIFDPALAKAGLKTILYSFTDTNQCSADTLFNITVNPKPTVSFSNLNSVCENAQAFILLQGSSAGSGGKGWYEGPGVQGDSITFRADSAGSGLHTINYFYQDRNSCIDSTSQSIQVDTVPRPIFVSTVPDFCANSSPYPLVEGLPKPTLTGERASYSGIGVLNGIFYPQYVSAGNQYTLSYSFTDVNGCSGEVVQNVAVNSLPTLTSNFIPTRCDNEGIDTLNFASIQSAGISSSYFAGVGIDPNDSLSFDPAVAGQGNHLISYHLTDTNGCSASTQSYVTIYASSQVYFGALGDLCENASSMVLTGGVPLGGSYSGSGVSSGRFNPSVADTGRHSLKYTYTNVFGCTDSAFRQITVNPTPSLNLGIANVYCERNSPYEFVGASPIGGSFSGIGVFNNKFYTNITSKGSFTINYSFTDTNSCSSTVSKTVQVVGNPNISTTPDTLICNGDRIRLRASGGVVYRWENGISGSSRLVNPNENKSYSVVVTDANGCIEEEEIKVFVSPEITLSNTTNDADCGASNGAASVQASGGVSPFGFVWSTGAIGDVQTNLRSGLYQVTVTDANRCSQVTVVPVSDRGAANIITDSIQHPSCAGLADGSIYVSVSGVNSPFNMEWNNGALTEDISNLGAGNYLLSVSDGENCLSFQSYNLVDPEEIELELVSTNSSCQNADAWVKAIANGSSNLIYQWSNSATTDSIGGLAAGVYALTVSNANGCVDSMTAYVSDIGGPKLVFDSIVNTACTELDGLVSIQVIDSSLTYDWNTGDISSTIDSLAGGLYTVTVTDTLNCKTIEKAEVNTIAPSVGNICLLTVDTALDRVIMYFENDTSASVESYRAYRSDISGTNAFLAGRVASGNSIVDTSLQRISTPWSYSLELQDSCSNLSERSDVHRIIYTTAVPLATGPIRIKWTAYEGFEPLRYTVFRSVNNGPFQVVNVVGAFQTSYFDAIYPPESTSLRYLVAADAPEDCNGISVSFSNKTVNVWDFVTTSIVENDLGLGFKVYPNPSRGIVNFEYNGLVNDFDLRIFNSAGQVVFERPYEVSNNELQGQIDLGNLATGVYQLQVISNQGMSIQKLQLVK